ncbi:MAG: glycosyltransferase family 9 protein [Acidobacteriaceae bacterium]
MISRPSEKFSLQSQSLSAAPKQLLIVRLGAMGDIIHTMPAVAALRSAFPQTIFGWLVEERWKELLSATLPQAGFAPCPLIDRIHTVNTKQWRKAVLASRTWNEIVSSVRDFRVPHYELAVDFQGAIRSSLLSRWSGAKRIYGFAHPRETPARMFYTDAVTASGAHIIEQNLSLAEAVTGTSLTIPAVEFPQDSHAEQQIDLLLRSKSVSKFILLNPGAGWGAKQWLAERYAEVATSLSKDGYAALVNFATAEEALARSVESASARSAIAVTTSIPELIALTRRASLFIGGDTGPLHLAAAMHIPVVAIFGPTNPARNGPFGTESIVLRSPSSVTDHSRHTETDPGLLEITAPQVVSAARQLLKLESLAR